MHPSEGGVMYQGLDGPIDLCHAPEPFRRRIMRTELGVVYQNPRDGLRMSISAGGNIGERLLANGARHYGNIRQRALTWLKRVEIDTNRIDDPPQTFSGGMQQRAVIAIATSAQPKLLIADEPTTALDVTVQAEILDLLQYLQ